MLLTRFTNGISNHMVEQLAEKRATDAAFDPLPLFLCLSKTKTGLIRFWKYPF